MSDRFLIYFGYPQPSEPPLHFGMFPRSRL